MFLGTIKASNTENEMLLFYIFSISNLFIDFCTSESINSEIFSDLFSVIFIFISFRKKLNTFDVYDKRFFLSHVRNSFNFFV